MEKGEILDSRFSFSTRIPTSGIENGWRFSKEL
jgi:hypothetical protein